jgi:hypothetical protein
LRIGICTAWIIAHTQRRSSCPSPLLTSLHHWIGRSPDAGQRDPPEPLAKIEEAQLSELCLDFLDLISHSLRNMRCGSHPVVPLTSPNRSSSHHPVSRVDLFALKRFPSLFTLIFTPSQSSVALRFLHALTIIPFSDLKTNQYKLYDVDARKC